MHNINQVYKDCSKNINKYKNNVMKLCKVETKWEKEIKYYKDNIIKIQQIWYKDTKYQKKSLYKIKMHIVNYKKNSKSEKCNFDNSNTAINNYKSNFNKIKQ